MKYTTKSHFSREEKLAIIREYETSPLSGTEICAKYGIKHQSLLCVWRSRLLNSQKSITFAPLKESNTPMPDAKDRRIAELEQQVLALNTLIDIAEEQGIQIRKKSGAKQ